MGVELGLTLQDALGEDLPTISISEQMDITTISRQIVNHIKSGEGDEVVGAVDKDFKNLSSKHIAALSSSNVDGNKADEKAQ